MSNMHGPTREAYSHPRCWANSRGDCCTKISREHYISDNVLKVLGAETVRGSAYTGGRPGIDIKRKEFGANVLCCCHNSELSPLDASVGDLLVAQCLFVAEMNALDLAAESEQADFSGNDLEKWILKCLVAQTVARIFETGGTTIQVPDLVQMTRLVFDRTPWPARWGLWMKNHPERALDRSNTIDIEPIWMHDGRKLGGGTIAIGGLDFRLSLFSPAQNDGGPFDGAMYRPSGIVYRSSEFQKVICLRWDDGTANPSISYSIGGAG